MKVGHVLPRVGVGKNCSRKEDNNIAFQISKQKLLCVCVCEPVSIFLPVLGQSWRVGTPVELIYQRSVVVILLAGDVLRKVGPEKVFWKTNRNSSAAKR